MKGAILACHRLKNKKRVLIKFQDMEDRDAVYQARFDQTQDPNSKVIIHENLTETRANMIRVLGQMREKDQITNYHTKNGMIYARNSRDKKYALIEPWLSEQEILNAVNSAQNKTSTGAGSFLTLLPGGEFRNPLKTRPKTSRNLCYSDDSENYFQKPLFFPESWRNSTAQLKKSRIPGPQSRNVKIVSKRKTVCGQRWQMNITDTFKDGDNARSLP